MWYNALCCTRSFTCGEPVDVWSCGVVLVTMLVGELPWSAPNNESPEYKAFMENDILQRRPWCRLDTIELSLLSMIFTENPTKRANISRIKKHPWYISELGYRADWKRKIPEYEPEYVKPAKMQKLEGIPLSQPAHMRSMKDKDSVVLINTKKPRQPLPPKRMSFSQPANFDHMVLNKSQVSASQFATYAHPIASLVRRMTRFCVTVTVEEAIAAIEKACKDCNCEWKMATSHQLQLTCLRNEDLSFIATVYEMIDEGSQRVLVDFRLSKGDGIEFKRKFVEFKKALGKLICKHSSSWLERNGLVCRKNALEIVAEANEKDKQRMPPPRAAEV
jgi:serine/threonine-protein kinase Chk1